MLLGPDTLDLIVNVAESGIIESSMSEIMARPQFIEAATRGEDLKNSIKNHLSKWRDALQYKITNVCDSDLIQEELSLYQQVIQWSESEFYEQIEAIVNHKLASTSAFYLEAKVLLNRNEAMSNPMFPLFFCDRWHESLTNSVKQMQLDELEKEQETLLDDLSKRVETLDKLKAMSNDSDDFNVGKMWDMSATTLTKSNIDIIALHAKFFKKNQELQKIAETLGRMATECQQQSASLSTVEKVQMVEEKSEYATDDIIGIYQNDNLSRLLPNELMFLSNPDLEVIFYQNLVDKRLMNYQMQGKNRVLRKVKTQTASSGKPNIDKGPFIICIDASGSMQGFPEQCSKAFAYGLMQIALAEERDCYVIAFSVQRIAYELTKQDGLREVADFLSYQFRGGTDLDPALEEAIELMHNEKYQNADLIVLSDFIAPNQSKKIDDMIEELKRKQNRFHALCLSKQGNPELMNLFDHTWYYHPSMIGRLVNR